MATPLLAFSAAEAAVVVAVARATADIITTAAAVVVTVVVIMLVAMADRATADITTPVAAVAVATVVVARAAARALTADMTRATSRVPPTPLPLPPRQLLRPRRPRRLRSPLPKVGIDVTTAILPPVPPLLVLADGFQKPNGPLLGFREAVFLRAHVTFRFAKGDYLRLPADAVSLVRADTP